MARAYDGDRGLRKKGGVAAHPEQHGGIKDFAEALGVGVVAKGEEDGSGFGEGVYLLIGSEPSVTFKDEANALGGKLQALKFGKAEREDTGGRTGSINCAKNAARPKLGREREREPSEAILIECGCGCGIRFRIDGSGE
jgi:hypothetical protein